MEGKRNISRRVLVSLLILAVLVIGSAAAGRCDDGLYKKTTAKIVGVTETFVKTEEGTDGTHNYEEKYYDQTLTAVIRNGAEKGETVVMKNRYGVSQVYDTKYSKGDLVFVDNLKKNTGSGADYRGACAGTKRDWLIISSLVLLFGLFLIAGGREGQLTILSLGLNMIAFYFVLRAYLAGQNIFLLMFPTAIFFAWMLLFFMYGRNERTWLAFASTVICITAAAALALVVLKFSGRIDYDFMDYLPAPYEQGDADRIFLSEVLVGCLGAVMDVVVTMTATVREIAVTGGSMERKALIRSCREVGDDLVGTMISLMFFTNIAACIPAFLLYMRNGIRLATILRYNVFFELARFLTGSIGIVLAIPVSSAVAVWYYRNKYGKKAETC